MTSVPRHGIAGGGGCLGRKGEGGWARMGGNVWRSKGRGALMGGNGWRNEGREARMEGRRPRDVG